jgi:hypothetical protein
MAGGKQKNRSNRKQGYLASSEPNSPTIARPGYPNEPEKQDSDLKSLLMMMIEDFKKDINNSLKELQENTIKGKGKKQNSPGSKNGTRNNKETTKGDNPGSDQQS